MIVFRLSFFILASTASPPRPRPAVDAGEQDVPDAFPAPAPAPVRDDEEVMPTRKKRGYVTLSDRAPRPSAPPDASSSDDEVMPTKRPRGPPKKRN